MFDEEAYRQKHNIQHKPAKAHRPMDLSDMVTPIPESEQPKKKRKPEPVSPEELGRQMDERLKKIMETEMLGQIISTAKQLEQVSVKKSLTHTELKEKSKLVNDFIKNNSR